MINTINKTKTKPTIGRKIVTIDVVKAVTVSTVEITGFAIPTVVAVDANRVAPEAPEIAAAVPPPAIIASAQVISGPKFATVDTITAVPAIAAKGSAIVSNKLSINGI